MCATFQFKATLFKPGREVSGVGRAGVVRHVWAGFARSEILEWWKRNGAVEIDIPAERFAERSVNSRKLAWDDVPEGFVIRGLLDTRTRHPLIKIVTRASSPEEVFRFEHPRMPLLEPPVYPAFDYGLIEILREPDLFD